LRDDKESALEAASLLENYPMSLRPEAHYPIPEETQRVARAAFPKGNLCLHLVDVLGPLYQDQQFTALFHPRANRVFRRHA
jgi:hypothetical protein